MSRPLPPSPEPRTPLCPICGDDTFHDGDGRLCCEPCGCSWPSRHYWNSEGEWNDPDEQQCPATIRPYLGDEQYPRLATTVYVCVLAVGHQPPHRSAPQSRYDVADDWTNDDTDGYLSRLCAPVRPCPVPT